MSMRYATTLAGLGALLLLAGCNNWPHTRPNDSVRPIDGRTPTCDQLVRYLNENAQRVQGLECRDLDIDAKQGGQMVGLSGTMVCEKPRNFRMQARLLGQPAVDIGSNDQEFWYWISKVEPVPYVFHCSYQDLGRGNVRMPFPFQPDWVIAALGIATYDPNKKYEVRETQTTVELIEQAVSPQGQPVRKVTVFSRGQATANRPQVTAHILQDASGKEIATAHISEVQRDPTSGAVLPRRLHLVWASEKIEMKMKLDGVRVAAVDPSRAATIFSRRTLMNLPSYDLARGPDAPAGQLQRTGGPSR
jgi:hypothetical protein